MDHPYYYARDVTSTSDICWYRIPTALIKTDKYILAFSYYGHKIEITLASDVNVAFTLINELYPPQCYTSLWFCTEREYKSSIDPVVVHYFTDDERKVHYSYHKTIDIDDHDHLYVGFYIYL